mmetsp:Transcript_17133/g.37900  ORF Transcript_17133/g.37900 Transcript_17133/m.37900 type:complete len:239 (-) Transcript_17133:718-1434(-)
MYVFRLGRRPVRPSKRGRHTANAPRGYGPPWMPAPSYLPRHQNHQRMPKILISSKDNDNGGEEVDGEGAAEEENSKGSGTPIWGAYAYWISREGYEALLSDLRNDVGGILWRGKSMPAYVVKPIDKVLPRRVMHRFGRDAVHVAALPSFVRAPMLRSTIHSQWDVEFCKSSEYQMLVAGQGVGRNTETEENNGTTSRMWHPLYWDDLWLTDDEKKVIARRKDTGDWSFVATNNREKRR